jgi:hypothetical protein
VRLGTADLLTRRPEDGGCKAAFDIAGDATLREGEQLSVESEGSSLVARRGQTVVARKDNPLPADFASVKNSCGIAQGTVAQVHDPARVAEISLC